MNKTKFMLIGMLIGTLISILCSACHMGAMVVSMTCNKKELVSKLLFVRGLKKIDKALERCESTDKGVYLLVEAALEYNNPHAQYALSVLAKNNIIKIPAEHDGNDAFSVDSDYYDVSTIVQVKTLIMKAQILKERYVQSHAQQ